MDGPESKIISLEDGLARLREKGMDVLEEYLETGRLSGVRDDGTRCLFTNKVHAELYTTVFDMATQKVPYNWAVQLYTYFGECIAAYCTKKVVPVLTSLKGHDLVEATLAKWKNHKFHVKWMERIFRYLDRYYVRLHSEPTLHDRGVSVFRELVFNVVRDELREATLTRIQESREGNINNRALLKDIVDMYLDLSYGQCNIYAMELEDYMLPATLDYYTKLSISWLESKTFVQYLEAAEAALTAEEKNFGSYLCERSLDNVQRAVVNALLANPIDRLLRVGRPIHEVLMTGNEQNLQRTYRLFNLVENGLAEIASDFKSYIQAEGNQIMDACFGKSNEDSVVSATENFLIRDLIVLHDKYKTLVGSAFCQDVLFQKALKEAFESFINRDIGEHGFSAQLSAYCNRLLTKWPSFAAIEPQLPHFIVSKYQNCEVNDENLTSDFLCRAIELFNYISEKDTFADLYRRALAKRLLAESSASEASERSMIAKLKLKCGNQFTSKLEGMLNDLSIAADWQQKYVDYRRKGENIDFGGIEFSAQVLHAGHWPEPPDISDVKLPSNMLKCTSAFETFYEANGGHYRKLTWIHGLGRVVIEAKYLAKPYNFTCDTYQACVLLLLNQADTISLPYIKEKTGLEDIFARKILLCLLAENTKLIVCTEELKQFSNISDVNELDIFTVNPSFHSSDTLVHIPCPQQDEQGNKERIEEDRSVAIEAAIVRIMKGKKQLSHQKLVSDVLMQLSAFQPNPKMVKISVEKLIEREFLDRDPSNFALYNYST